MHRILPPPPETLFSCLQTLAVRSPTLPPGSHSNCYMVGNQDALLIDPGTAFFGEVERILRRAWWHLGRGGTFQSVVLTHHHPDHVAGAWLLTHALRLPLWAHPETLQRLPAPPPNYPRAATRHLHDGDILRIGKNLALTVVHTPGHAPGHLCFFEPKSRSLFSGDIVLGRGTTLVGPPDGDMAVYLQSLQRLAQWNPRWILPGHGPLLEEGTAAIGRLVAHRQKREKRVWRVLTNAPQGLGAITRSAYSDTPWYLWPLAWYSTLGHLEKLEREGRAWQDGEKWARAAPCAPPKG